MIIAYLKLSPERKQKRSYTYNWIDKIETQVFNPQTLLFVDFVKNN